ncbi:MAG: ceramide glucosyltransferase [Nitrospirota bacterium]
MVALLFYSIAAFGLVLYVIQVFAVRSCVSAPGKATDFMPPVSILKPLKGIDDNLFDNLESFCKQDYPEYEIVFALRDLTDPACKVALKVKDKYPDQDITIVAKWCDDGLNPKVNNLIPAYRVSKYGLVLVSDSNVLVEKDYLREIVRHMEDPEVGLVSSLIRGIRARTLGSVFENLHLNSFTVGGVCFLEKVLKMPCVVGKSMLLRKKHFEEIGEWSGVKEYLAEDYILGRKMKEAGKKVVLSNHFINTVNEYWQVGQFTARHTRWGKLRWRIGGPKYFAELIGNPVLMSLIPLMVFGPTRITLPATFLVWSLKSLGDYSIGRTVRSDLHPLFYLFVPLKDIIIGIVWFVPIFSNKVEWRGDRYIISKDSFLYPCPEDETRSVAAY